MILMNALRGVIAAHTCALLAEPALAGEFLSGTDGIVKFHAWTAWVILGLCAIQIGLTAVVRRSGLVSWWLLLGTVFVMLAEILQTASGYLRFLRVHVPLGAILFGVVLLQAIFVFRAHGLTTGSKPGLKK